MLVEVSEAAPNFTLPDAERQPRSLQELTAKGPVVLAFYFADFTGVCTKEMCFFSDGVKKFEDLKAQVVGISADSPFSHKAFAEKHNIKVPLLSDWNREVIKSYGVYHEEIAGLRMMPKRSVFIVDTKGTVRYKWVTEKPSVEPNYEEIATAVKNL